MNKEFQLRFDALRERIEARLESYFAGDLSLLEAMRYSVAAGGKRIRPVFTLAFVEACRDHVCGTEEAMDAACAVELLHTYSLIHDDLPAMDDDDMRRGKPSNHVAFGEALAILAGDALQAEAFAKIAGCDLPAERVVKMIAALAEAAGADGICGGQTFDMQGSDDLYRVHSMKTASLIAAAVKIGVIAAGGSAEQLSAAEEFANGVGLAFQIRDDVLDATGSAEALGKPVGSDAEQGKQTFYTRYGAAECERLIAEHTKAAKDAVRAAFVDAELLCAIADELAMREN